MVWIFRLVVWGLAPISILILVLPLTANVGEAIADFVAWLCSVHPGRLLLAFFALAGVGLWITERRLRRGPPLDVIATHIEIYFPEPGNHLKTQIRRIQLIRARRQGVNAYFHSDYPAPGGKTKLVECKMGRPGAEKDIEPISRGSAEGGWTHITELPEPLPYRIWVALIPNFFIRMLMTKSGNNIRCLYLRNYIYSRIVKTEYQDPNNLKEFYFRITGKLYHQNYLEISIDFSNIINCLECNSVKVRKIDNNALNTEIIHLDGQSKAVREYSVLKPSAALELAWKAK